VADARVAVAGVDRDAVPRAVAGFDAALAVAGLVEARLAAEPAGLAAAFFGAVAAFAVLALAAPDFAVSVGTDLPPRS
jgi:hypothetical protein